jgi:hypothetical protein
MGTVQGSKFKVGAVVERSALGFPTEGFRSPFPITNCGIRIEHRASSAKGEQPTFSRSKMAPELLKSANAVRAYQKTTTTRRAATNESVKAAKNAAPSGK